MLDSFGAPPRILAMRFSSLDVHRGQEWSGSFVTGTNVASVEVRTNLFSINVPHRSPGRFAFTLDVLGEQVGVGALPRATIGRVNRRVGATMVKKIARRRAKVILGRELPLGVGVAIGAGFNYVMMRRVGRAAIKYFEM